MNKVNKRINRTPHKGGGNRHGDWLGIGDDGGIRYKGTFVNNKHVGLWEWNSFDQDGWYYGIKKYFIT